MIVARLTYSHDWLMLGLLDNGETQMTDNLIPTNGVHIIETYHPKGYSVARYDAEGFTSNGRWFETREKAQAYAASLKTN